MFSAILTHAQLFGIGFSFGIIGPCLLVCSPIIITYMAGMKKRWPEALKDIFIFLSGRLAAYLLLGCLAGLSGGILRRFMDPGLASFFKPAAGVLSIIFAIVILVNKKPANCECGPGPSRIYNFSGLFIFGFLIGISPCAPLVAILSEIVLMSKNAYDGISYALSFGMGTFLSGLIAVGAISGIVSWLPDKYLKSNAGNLIFKILCAALLILLGLSLIAASIR